jgi:hypothetical protein
MTTTPRLLRYADAYLQMANEARYRPSAPGDGCGHIDLTRKQLADRERLHDEAVGYAMAFSTEEDTRKFNIGCSNYTTNRAFIFTIEAARVLAGSWNVLGDELAVRLLEMAIDEIKCSKSGKAA